MFLVLQGEVLPTIFDTLVRECDGARLEPALASELRAEEGGRRFRFRLRDGVRFHDGRRVTARDVRYSLERLLLNGDSESRWFFEPIRGAAGLLAGRSRELEGFRIHSDAEFSIELDRPLAFFPALLAFPSASIVPEGTTNFVGGWRDGCVGTGPFRVVRFEPGRRLKLEANPYYWRAELPRLASLVFTFGVPPAEIAAGFRSGRFSLAWDLLPSDVDALRHDPAFAAGYRDTPRLGTYYVALNVHRGPLRDEALRHALVGSLDVDEFVGRIPGALALRAHSLVPPGLLGHEPTWGSAARDRPLASTFTTVDLTCLINSVYEGTYAGLATDLFREMRQGGFRVHVLDTKSEYHKNQAEALAGADVLLTRWIADYPDADSFYFSLLHTEHGIVGRVCGTPELDALIARGRSEPDPDARHDVYREIEETIARRALLVPLFHEKGYCFARPEVHDFHMNLFPPLVAFERLSLRG
jgi:ABC-type transport system substrate-binding protein